MTKKILLIVAAIIAPVALNAQISGTITTSTHQAVAKAIVSDGYNCVATDSKGQYTLPHNPKARFVSLTKPSGYKIVGNHYQKANEKTPLNFVIEKSTKENGKQFQFVHITDVESFNHKEWIENLKEWCATNPTAFVINTGDICYERGLKFNGTQVRSPQIGTDMFYIPGNHDLVKGEYGEHLFEKYFGPSYYSFDAGNIHFLALPMLGGDYRPSYTKQQVMNWIKADLKLKDPSKKVVMLNHDLWFRGDDLKITSENDTIDMAQHNLIAFFYGHWHSHYVKDVAGIKTYSNSPPDKGGIDHGPSVFRVLTVDENDKISSQTRYTYINGSITTVAPASGDVLAPGSIPVSVNAYRTSSPTSKVRVCVDNKWTELKQTSDWNYSGKLKLSKGKYTMLCEAAMIDGTILRTTTAFEVGDKPTLEWVAALGSNVYMTSPVTIDGLVVTATIDDDNNTKSWVSAFDSSNGRQVWRTPTDNSIKNTIAAAQGKVVACDSDGKLYCFEALTGRVIWKTLLSKYLLPHTLQGITIADGTVYAGQGSGFSAVDLQSGKVLWSNSHWSGGEGTTSTITVAGDVVIASGHWNGIFAHNRHTGELLWKKQDAQTRFRDGSPTYSNGLLYLATTNALMEINPTTGYVSHNKTISGFDFSVAAAPLIVNDTMYCSTSNRGVVAIDRNTFSVLWSYNASPAMFYTVPYSQDFQASVELSPVLHNGVLIFGASDGNLYGVNATDGTSAFVRYVGSPIFATPKIDNNSLYVNDFAGNLLKLNIKQ